MIAASTLRERSQWRQHTPRLSRHQLQGQRTHFRRQRKAHPTARHPPRWPMPQFSANTTSGRLHAIMHACLAAAMSLMISNATMQHLPIVTTGGTIDKVYVDAKSNYEVGAPQIGDIPSQLGGAFVFDVAAILRKDSLELTGADRRLIPPRSSRFRTGTCWSRTEPARWWKRRACSKASRKRSSC
jgi:hypothetical protein